MKALSAILHPGNDPVGDDRQVHLDEVLPEIHEEPEASDYQFRGYGRDVVDQVWGLAEAVEGNDPEIWRKDEFGAWINRLEYGNRKSDFGWDIADPPSGGLEMGLASLRAMQWQNYLDQVAASTQSRITADGLRNIRRLL